MSLQARKAEIHLGSTKQVHNRLAVAASERQRSEVHSLLQPWASTPEGPAAPSTCIATDLMHLSSSASNITGVVLSASGGIANEATFFLQENCFTSCTEMGAALQHRNDLVSLQNNLCTPTFGHSMSTRGKV